MLQYIRDQLDTIEEGIKQSWVDVQSGNPPSKAFFFLRCYSGKSSGKVFLIDPKKMFPTS
jgi:hypothetical protein